MPRNNTKSKQMGQSATASVPLPKSAAPPPSVTGGAAKSIEQLRAEAAAAEKFAAWAATADDDEAPGALFYPRPAGQGKGHWSWQSKAAHDAKLALAALKAAEAAAAAADAAKPLAAPAAAEEDEGPCYVGVPEAPEVTAERLARWAAEGRSPSGVLLSQAPLCAKSCCAAPRPARRWSDRECQQVVDLFGWHHGAELILEHNEGWSLDELYGAEMQEAWDAYCGALRASEAAREAAAKAQMEANWRRACVEQAMVEARRNLRRGEAVQKNGRICTRCYSCEGNKHTDWEDGGKKARPSTLHVSSECFTHAEFLAGRIREDCPFLHHGDAGWHAEWDSNFLWDPMHPESMPTPKHIRKREGDAQLCISEKSAGYLPVHLGGKADGMDARQWRQQTMGPAAAAAPQRAFAERAVEERWAPMRGGGSQPQQDLRSGGGGGSARAGPGSAWAKRK